MELETIDPAVIESYADEDNAGEAKPTLEFWVGYLRYRYEEIKGGHTTLLCKMREAKASGREDIKAEVLNGIHANYINRKTVVNELRKAGEKVDDPFIKA